jgi:Peptidase family M23
MVAGFGWFWLWHMDLGASTLVLVAAAVIALPLALQESDTERAGQRTVVVTRRSLILANVALVTLVYLDDDGGVWPYALAAACVFVPLALAVSRVSAARRGQVELGLLRHPLHREVRAHLVQALNIWLCCVMLAGLVAAGGMHIARIWLSLNEARFAVLIGAFVGGLVLLAALALVPRRRVDVPTNAFVAVLSAFLAVALMPMAVAPTDAVVVDSPLAGEWFVQNGGRTILINGHRGGEDNAVDFQLMGTNGRTHTGGGDAPLSDYAGFGMPVLAPADGRIVDVTDHHPDNPPGTNGDSANHVVIDIGNDRYVALAHLKQSSVTVQVGDDVRTGEQIAALGNNGHSDAPHLHLQVQDSPAGQDAERTYPMLFRDAHIIRGGFWPWGDNRELHSGDVVRTPGQ